MTRFDIVAEARTWVGTKWQHQASLKGVATDCVGLVGGVARALELPGGEAWTQDPLIKGYGRIPDPDMLLAACDRYMDEVHQWRMGDVLVMRARNHNEPTHFAIVSAMDPPYIIHSRLLRKVSENRLDDGLRGLVMRAYAFRGVA